MALLWLRRRTLSIASHGERHGASNDRPDEDPHSGQNRHARSGATACQVGPNDSSCDVFKRLVYVDFRHLVPGQDAQLEHQNQDQSGSDACRDWRRFLLVRMLDPLAKLLDNRRHRRGDRKRDEKPFKMMFARFVPHHQKQGKTGGDSQGASQSAHHCCPTVLRSQQSVERLANHRTILAAQV